MDESFSSRRPILASVDELMRGGAVERAGALPPALLVALVVAVAWWRAVTRTAVGVARGRVHSWLLFWALWILGWIVVFASSAMASVLAPTIGWLVPSVLQVLVVAALWVVAHEVEGRRHVDTPRPMPTS